jgi:CMP-N,N'-diacetyllegionaminic acid synthase
MSHIAVIPARSGSKGIPDKNMRTLWGQSLIAWAAQCAHQTGLFSQVILSTDSKTYAEEGLRHGCVVPYLRPPELAVDSAPTAPVLLDLIDQVAGAAEWETLTLLEPTCPLRTPEMVTECFQLFAARPTDQYCVTVSQVPGHYHPLKQLVMNTDQQLAYYDTEGETIYSRHQLNPTFVRNGAAYVLNCKLFQETGQIIHGQGRGLIIQTPLVNLDTMDDLERLQQIEATRLPHTWQNQALSVGNSP